MEKWQREFINEHLPELIKSINCDVLLLAYLAKYGALSSPTETDYLNSIQGGQANKVSELIRILQEREGGYGHLAKALQECTQTGAFSILLQGIQQKLILRDVFFGGVRLPLKNVCKSIDTESLQNIITSEVNVETYQEFINSEPWTLEAETVPKSMAYCIPRTLSINNEIDIEIFTKLESDIFCIEGAELHQLYQLASRNGKHQSAAVQNLPDRSRNQIHGVTTRFIVLERYEHFPDIAGKSAKPVHWLQCSHAKYWYVKSSPGSEVKNVSKFLVPNGAIHLSEEEFIERCVNISGNEPVFIYDSPGMGKSVLLANLARGVKERRREDSVIHFKISDLIQKVHQCGESCSLAGIKETIVQNVGVNKLGRKILRKLLNTRDYQIQLFLDGYDKVNQKNATDADRILDNLVDEGGNVRVFVATRPHKKTALDAKFGVLGYNILPFDQSNKLSFVLEYWKSEHGVDITDGMEEFAKHCLDTVATKMSSAENDVAAIPLQVRMLADIFAEDAKKGALIPTESKFQLNSIFQLVKLFIDKRFSMFCTDAERQSYYDFHRRESLRTLFPQACKNWPEETPLPDPDLIYRIGILEPIKSNSSRPTFSHRTLAECFAAEFLATSATSTLPMNATESELFIQLFFRQALKFNLHEKIPTGRYLLLLLWITRNFENHVLCRFIDFFLSTMHSDGQDFGHVRTTLIESNIYSSKTILGLLEGSLKIDAVHLYLYLLKVYLDLDELRDNHTGLLRIKQDLSNTENWKETKESELLNCLKEEEGFPHLVVIAARFSSLNLVKLSCDLLENVTGKKVHQFQFDYERSPMYLALERGHYQIFEYLLSFNKEQYYEMPLLHLCLDFSYCRRNVEDWLQIVKGILDERPDLLNKPHPDYDNASPLLSHRAHFLLTKYLIEAGANLTETDEENRNIAHLTANYLSAEEYHELVQIIISRNAQIIFKQRDRERLTPVHRALVQIDLKSETLELLAKTCNVNFNNHSWRGSELAIAIKEGRRERVIKDIIRLGGDKNQLNMEVREKLAINYNIRNETGCIIN